jgi:hypothetical protein
VTIITDKGHPVSALVATDEVAEAEMAKLPRDKLLRADIVAPRNIGLHRKAFVLLNKVLPHSNYPTIDALRAAMTIGAGFVEATVDPYSGEVVWYPKSWKFDHLDDVEFQELYSRLIDVALQIIPNSKREDWENAVDEVVRM